MHQRASKNRGHGAADATVYVPAPDHPAMAGIVPGSAILGSPVDTDSVRIYFEGAIYGQINLSTFGRRARLAFGRMIERAPTSAMRVVPCEALIAIGTYSASREQVVLAGEGCERKLLAWLGEEHLDPTEPAGESRRGS